MWEDNDSNVSIDYMAYMDYMDLGPLSEKGCHSLTPGVVVPLSSSCQNHSFSWYIVAAITGISVLSFS